MLCPYPRLQLPYLPDLPVSGFVLNLKLSLRNLSFKLLSARTQLPRPGHLLLDCILASCRCHGRICSPCYGRKEYLPLSSEQIQYMKLLQSISTPSASTISCILFLAQTHLQLRLCRTLARNRTDPNTISTWRVAKGDEHVDTCMAMQVRRGRHDDHARA